MNAIIEAGARAIYEEECRIACVCPDWDGLTTRAQEPYRYVFRAAVRAMMEAPVSDAMTKAGEQFGWIEAESTELWRAMCAAVLSEGGVMDNRTHWETCHLEYGHRDCMIAKIAEKDARIAQLEQEGEISWKQIENQAALIATLQGNIAELSQWINDLHTGMYINCVYCGHRYGPNDEVPSTMADVLKTHIEMCPMHPMSALKRELAEAQEKHKAQWRVLDEERCVLRAETERLRKAAVNLSLAIDAFWNDSSQANARKLMLPLHLREILKRQNELCAALNKEPAK